MAYMVEGETEFDSLKCLFQEGLDSSDNEKDAAEIMGVSSDHVDGGCVDDANEETCIANFGCKENNTGN